MKEVSGGKGYAEHLTCLLVSAGKPKTSRAADCA